MLKKLVTTGVTLGIGFAGGMFYTVAKTLCMDDYQFESLMEAYRREHENVKKHKRK